MKHLHQTTVHSLSLRLKKPKVQKVQKSAKGPEVRGVGISDAKLTFTKKCFKIISNSYFFENKLDNGKNKGLNIKVITKKHRTQ